MRSMRSRGRCPTGSPSTNRASRTEMVEDWRIHVKLEDTGGRGPGSAYRLEARELAEDMRGELGDRVAVSRDNGELFLYANGEDAARATERVVRADIDEHGRSAAVELTRWHEDAAEWMSPDVAMPATEAERRAEHSRLAANEDTEAAAQG